MLMFSVPDPLARRPLNVGNWSTNFGTLLLSSSVCGRRTLSGVAVKGADWAPIGSLASLDRHPIDPPTASHTPAATENEFAKRRGERMLFLSDGSGPSTTRTSPPAAT